MTFVGGLDAGRTYIPVAPALPSKNSCWAKEIVSDTAVEPNSTPRPPSRFWVNLRDRQSSILIAGLEVASARLYPSRKLLMMSQLPTPFMYSAATVAESDVRSEMASAVHPRSLAVAL